MAGVVWVYLGGRINYLRPLSIDDNRLTSSGNVGMGKSLQDDCVVGIRSRKND